MGYNCNKFFMILSHKFRIFHKNHFSVYQNTDFYLSKTTFLFTKKKLLRNKYYFFLIYIIYYGISKYLINKYL